MERAERARDDQAPPGQAAHGQQHALQPARLLPHVLGAHGQAMCVERKHAYHQTLNPPKIRPGCRQATLYSAPEQQHPLQPAWFLARVLGW